MSDPIGDLFAEMEAAGWQLATTGNGHVRAKSPDGGTLLHLPSKDGGGRSLANSRARFKAWQREQQQADPVAAPYACDQCDRRLTSPQGLAVHRSRSHSGQARCQVCGGTFARSSLMTHMRAKHPDGPEPSRDLEPAHAAAMDAHDQDQPPAPLTVAGPPDWSSEQAAVALPPQAVEVGPDSLAAVVEDLLAIASRLEHLSASQDHTLRERLRQLLEEA